MDKSRTELLIGAEGLTKLASKHITVVGVGGVGGYTAVMLARAGIENMTIIDFDKVSSSNINRQIVAYQSTIGKFKVDVLREMLFEINPNINLKVVAEKISKDNVANFIQNTDLVVDAIDSVADKIALIVYCKKHNIKIISAMGAGNRSDVPKFECIDIYKTHHDGLAKVVRKKLREEEIDSLDVVTTSSQPESAGRTIGSISYYPAMCGCTLSAEIINRILEEKI